MIDNILFIFILMSLSLGLCGWIIHLYTLILSYFSDKKWTIRLHFNCYHEAIPELIVFSVVIIFNILVIKMVWR